MNRFDAAGLYWSTCNHCGGEILQGPDDDGCLELCSGCVEDIHEHSTCTVYRGLRDDEDVANGIIAQAPNAQATLQEHISGAAVNTQFISTSLDIQAAIYFALHGFFFGHNNSIKVVEVQVLIDESESFYRDNYSNPNFPRLEDTVHLGTECVTGMARNFARTFQEVCFSRPIRSNEIVKVYHLPQNLCNGFQNHMINFNVFRDHYNGSILQAWVVAEQQRPICVVIKSLLVGLPYHSHQNYIHNLAYEMALRPLCERNQDGDYNVKVSHVSMNGTDTIGYVCREHLHLLQGRRLNQMRVSGDWDNFYEQDIYLTVSVSRADFESFKYMLNDVRGSVETCY